MLIAKVTDRGTTRRVGRPVETEKGSGVKKWLENAAISAVVAVVAVVFVGMYSTWRDCSAAGGTTVRGLFGLECIKR